MANFENIIIDMLQVKVKLNQIRWEFVFEFPSTYIYQCWCHIACLHTYKGYILYRDWMGYPEFGTHQHNSYLFVIQ